jgi:hypothetical protein
MTADLLPIIEQMLDLTDDRERADWLKRLPAMTIARERRAITDHFEGLGWPEAGAYAGAVTAALDSVRMGDGQLRPAVRRALDVATRALDDSVAARRGRRVTISGCRAVTVDPPRGFRMEG